MILKKGSLFDDEFSNKSSFDDPSLSNEMRMNSDIDLTPIERKEFKTQKIVVENLDT